MRVKAVRFFRECKFVEHKGKRGYIDGYATEKAYEKRGKKLVIRYTRGGNAYEDFSAIMLVNNCSPYSDSFYRRFKDVVVELINIK